MDMDIRIKYLLWNKEQQEVFKQKFKAFIMTVYPNVCSVYQKSGIKGGMLQGFSIEEIKHLLNLRGQRNDGKNLENFIRLALHNYEVMTGESPFSCTRRRRGGDTKKVVKKKND